jgi:phosphoglycerol transferase MdoB-like AlkP superfamily enzyme
MSLSRAAFVLYFGDMTSLALEIQNVFKAFLLGIRFDVMPLAYILVLPFLILNFAYLLPGKLTIKTARYLVIGSIHFGFLLLVFVYICDYAFFSFFQDHINILFYGLIEDDTTAVLISIWKNYNIPLWLGFILLSYYSFHRLILFLFSPFDFDLKPRGFDKRYPLVFLFGIVFIAYCGRGNFGRLPLSIEDAHISTNTFINKISLNGVISLNRAIKIRAIFGKGSFDYFKKYGYHNWQAAFADAKALRPSTEQIKTSLLVKVPRNPLVERNPPHVVLVVMESFGSFWNQSDGQEFNLLGKLKNHFQEGILFKNFLPAENGTIGSLVSVATSQVIRPGARFLSESEFMNVPLASSGHIAYQKSGYETHFVYGGKLGWRDLGKYLKTQGYNNIWGANEIKEAMPELRNVSDEDLGNEWGIFDEYLYTFIEERLRTATKPQFILVLTTTNHPPFEYPSSYKPLPLILTQERLDGLTVREDLAISRFLGLQYANQKIGEFLDRIKLSQLKDNTVLALTGDHSFWIAKGVEADSEFRRFSVPFFISLPSQLKPENYDQESFGSHEDIFPTLYHLTLSNQEYIGIGENMLGGNSFAINSSGLVANKSGAFHHNKFWKWKDLSRQVLEPSEETEELSVLKRHSSGLISITDLYLKEEKTSKRSDAKNGQ